MLLGKKNLEVRPQQINKGEVIKRLIARHQSNNVDFIFCAGDDKTDEDMFKALRVRHGGDDDDVLSGSNSNANTSNTSMNVFTCTIGPATKKTMATSHLNESKDLVELLSLLVDGSS